MKVILLRKTAQTRKIPQIQIPQKIQAKILLKIHPRITTQTFLWRIFPARETQKTGGAGG